MWGEVTPAERLRSVTRRNVDDDRLAAEAADALAGFADEPASLVVACRRVLAHHRAHGQLWWVCARILAAAEPAAAAHTAVQELEADRTGDRLGATLPLLDEGEVVAIDRLARGDRRGVARTLRPRRGRDPRRRRRSRRGVAAAAQRSRGARRRRVGSRARHDVPASLVLGGRDRSRACARADRYRRRARRRSARRRGRCGSSVVSGGCCPARVYEMLVPSRAGRRPTFEEISLQRFDRIAGPRGLERPADAVARVDCPVVPELLRPLD